MEDYAIRINVLLQFVCDLLDLLRFFVIFFLFFSLDASLFTARLVISKLNVDEKHVKILPSRLIYNGFLYF